MIRSSMILSPLSAGFRYIITDRDEKIERQWREQQELAKDRTTDRYKYGKNWRWEQQELKKRITEIKIWRE